MAPTQSTQRRADEVRRICRDSKVPQHIQSRLQRIVDDVQGEKRNLETRLNERRQKIHELWTELARAQESLDPPLEELYRAGSKLITRQADDIGELKKGLKADAEVIARQAKELENLKAAPKPSPGSSAIITKQAEQIRNLQIALEEARIANPDAHFTSGLGMAEEQATAALNLVRNLQRDVVERDRVIKAQDAEMASSAAASMQAMKEMEGKVKGWQVVAEDSQKLIRRLDGENRELVRHLTGLTSKPSDT